MVVESGALRRFLMIALQAVVVVIGIAAVGLLLWEPRIEGRNVGATLFEIYFQDPFLAFAYVASIPFFVALYQAFKVLGLAGRGALTSPEGPKALRIIKLCAVAMMGFVAAGEAWIMLQPSDDRAGGVAMGVLIAVGAIAIGATAAGVEGAVTRSRS